MYAILNQLLEPFTFLVLSLAINLFAAWCLPRSRNRLLKIAGVPLGLLVLSSMPATAHLALGTLEWGYPATPLNPTPDDTIVVLSGSIYVDDDEGKRYRLSPDTFQRCHYAAKLYQQAGQCHLLVSGGKTDWSIPGPTFGVAMRDFLVELGIRPEDVLVEDESTTTYENALFSKPLLDREGTGRILLVTEASHMFRAERCFRLQGIPVTPAPCDYHANRWEWAFTNFLPSAGAASKLTRVTHEWLGCLWYRLRGRI